MMYIDDSVILLVIALGFSIQIHLMISSARTRREITRNNDRIVTAIEAAAEAFDKRNKMKGTPSDEYYMDG